jgi:hypothetical protein
MPPLTLFQVSPEFLDELLLAGVLPEECREAAAHYRQLAELPENAAIREQILRVAAKFDGWPEHRANLRRGARSASRSH